ncbi:MAG TPA: zf-HC2 domain-containing protein [Gemmatimonadaceae bacterium]|nr:zf-HC2 domain-containing protein [Gemmatimonadaceae bacterium]
MQHPEEGTIHAWLDGALDAEESARVEEHVAECATCASAVAEARGLVAGASRILAALDDVPSGVVPRSGGSLGGGSASGQRRPRSLWTYLHMTPARAAAAAFLIVGAGTVLVMRERSSPTARQLTYTISAPVASRPNVSVPASPLPAPSVADSASFVAGAREEPAKARKAVETASAADEARPLPMTVTAAAPAPSLTPHSVPAPIPPVVASRKADVEPKRSLNLEQVVVTSTESAKSSQAPAAGGAIRAASPMAERARSLSLLNYAGCYSVAARGDSQSPLPKLVSLDSARFDKALAAQKSLADNGSPTQLFAVSTVTGAGRRAIDTASWQPLLDGIRISFGQTPIDLRRSADSTLSAPGAAGRGVSVTLQRVDCPPR